MQERPVDGQAADPEPDHQDAHVLDARVREHPLEVALAYHEHGGKRHRQQTHRDQNLTRELRFPGSAANLVDPDNREEGTTRDAARE